MKIFTRWFSIALVSVMLTGHCLDAASQDDFYGTNGDFSQMEGSIQRFLSKLSVQLKLGLMLDVYDGSRELGEQVAAFMAAYERHEVDSDNLEKIQSSVKAGLDNFLWRYRKFLDGYTISLQPRNLNTCADEFGDRCDALQKGNFNLDVIQRYILAVKRLHQAAVNEQQVELAKDYLLGTVQDETPSFLQQSSKDSIEMKATYAAALLAVGYHVDSFIEKVGLQLLEPKILHGKTAGEELFKFFVIAIMESKPAANQIFIDSFKGTHVGLLFQLKNLLFLDPAVAKKARERHEAEQQKLKIQWQLEITEKANQQALMDAREKFRNHLQATFDHVSSEIDSAEGFGLGEGDWEIVQARQQAMRQEAHHISVDFWAEQGAFNTADIALFQEYYVTIGHTQQHIVGMIEELKAEMDQRQQQRIEEARRAEEEARLEQDRQEQRRVQQERMRLEEEQRRQQEEAMRLAEERRQEEARLEAQRQENLRQIRAAITIQRAYRSSLGRSLAKKIGKLGTDSLNNKREQLRVEQEAAQRKEAARLRKQAADKERAEKLQKMKQGQAATKIQAQMRGFVARQKYGRALAEKRSEEEAIRQEETRRREELERQKQAQEAVVVAVPAPRPAPRKPQPVAPVAESLPLLRHAETQQHVFGPTQAGWQGGKETAAADADAARWKKLEELRRQQVQQGTEGTRQVSDLERGLAEINAERDWSTEVLRTTNAADENQRSYVLIIVDVLREIANLTGTKIQRYPQMNGLANGAEFKKVLPLLTQQGRDLLRATVASEGIDLSFAREAQDKQKISAEGLETVLGMLSK